VEVHDLNAASKRAAVRFGFRFEGEFRQHMIIKGRNRDSAWFSMLDSEWPARRAALERWLVSIRRQKVSLTSLNADRETACNPDSGPSRSPHARYSRKGEAPAPAASMLIPDVRLASIVLKNSA
jgi:hypothetical protein